jgi:hypothetical protein
MHRGEADPAVAALPAPRSKNPIGFSKSRASSVG